MKAITKIDADAAFHTPIGWQSTIFDGQCLLNLNVTVDCIQCTIELSQNAVARFIDFPSMFFLDQVLMILR
jgi:hypothetical protein